MAVVLYEDRRGDMNEFGLHRFVCQCVLDANAGLAGSVRQLEKKICPAIVCRGSSKVFESCKKDLPKLANDHQMVFAVYDQDKLNDLLSLKGRQCRNALRSKLAEPCEPKESLEIILIDKNLESVIEKIRDSGDAGFVRAEVFQQALGKKRSARDSLFIQCANQEKDVRERLLNQLSDVKRLVSKIVGHLSKSAE